jgi:hypothetical protein
MNRPLAARPAAAQARSRGAKNTLTNCLNYIKMLRAVRIWTPTGALSAAYRRPALRADHAPSQPALIRA